jgi:sugar diacid utilization regulator
MEIDSFVLFYLLEKRLGLARLNECKGVAARQPLILDTDRLSEGSVYISDDPEKVRTVRRAAPCVLLLIGSPEHYELSLFWEDCDIACIESPLPVVQALQSVYALLLDLLGWDMRLNNASLEGAEYEKIFRVIREMHDTPLILHDRNFFTIACTGDFYDYFRNAGNNREQIPLEMINDFFTDEERGRNLFEFRNPFVHTSFSGGDTSFSGGRQWLCYNIFNDDYFQGRLIAMSDGASGNIRGQLDLLAHYCAYISRVFIHHATTLMERKQRDPLHELIRSFLVDSKDIAEREIAAVLKDGDWQLQDDYALALFHIPDTTEYENWSAHICRQAESAILKSTAIMAKPFILWVINEGVQGDPRNRHGDFFDRIPGLVQRLCCTVGVSNSISGFGDLRKGYKQAEAALRLGRKRGERFGCYRFSDHIVEYIIDRAAQGLSAEDLLHPGLMALIRYDRENGTEYLKTIRHYADARYNMTVAASKIPVHRLTFLRRLEKIREISRINFEEPEELLHLHLSLKMLDIF